MYAIVSDTTAYLTAAEAKACGVTLVPMSYTDTQNSYFETYADQNADFQRVIGKGRWATSQPSVSAFKSIFSFLAETHEEILCLVMSSRLSGAYSSALLAAGDVRNAQICVVDSLATAGGLKMQIRRAAELRRAGVAVADAAAVLNEERDQLHSIFSVDDMEPLRRSGRLGVVRQAIGTILNIRPILMLENGAVVTQQLAKGKHDQLKKLTAAVPESASEIDIGYFGSPESAAGILSILTGRFPKVKITLSNVGPVLGIHLGLTAIGIAYRVK